MTKDGVWDWFEYKLTDVNGVVTGTNNTYAELHYALDSAMDEVFAAEEVVAKIDIYPEELDETYML